MIIATIGVQSFLPLECCDGLQERTEVTGQIGILRISFVRTRFYVSCQLKMNISEKGNY